LTSKRAVTKVQSIIIVVIIALGVVGAAYYYGTSMPSTPTASTTLAPSVQYKRTLVIAIPEEPASLDMQQVSKTGIVHSLVFQNIMNFDANMTIVPDLASSEQFNGTTIVVHFPQNVSFSNGDPITAQAYNDSITRYIALSPYDPIIPESNGSTL